MASPHSHLWDTYSKCYDSLTHLVPYRLLLSQVAGALSGCDTVLDCGCGTGNLSQQLSRTRCLVGMDFSSDMLRRATLKSQRHARLARFVTGDLERGLPFRSRSLDAVACINSLYAVQNLEALLGDFRRVLRPGGILLVVDPRPGASSVTIWLHHLLHRESGVSTVRHWLATFRLAPIWILVGLVNGLITLRARRGRYHFRSADEWQRLLKSAGFQAVKASLTYAGQATLIEGTAAAK